MSEPFDPYHRWLGIPPRAQPPHHYRLLGLELFETDPKVIDSLASRHIEYLQQVTDGPCVKEAQRLLNELASARRCLLDAEKRAAYDAELRTKLAGLSPPLPTAVPAPSGELAESVAPPAFDPSTDAGGPADSPIAVDVKAGNAKQGISGAVRHPRPARDQSLAVSRWVLAGSSVAALLLVVFAIVWLIRDRSHERTRMAVLRGEQQADSTRELAKTSAERPAVPAKTTPPPEVRDERTGPRSLADLLVQPTAAPSLPTTDGLFPVETTSKPNAGSDTAPLPTMAGPPPIPTDQLLLWLDAADSLTLELDEDARIRQWRDKSSNGLHASVEDTGHRPRIIETALHGRPLVRFSGAEWLEVPSKADLGAEYTLVFVARGREGTLLSKGSGDSDGSFSMFDGVAGFRVSGSDLHAGEHDAQAFGVRCILADASNVRWYVGGAECGKHADTKHAVKNSNRLRMGCILARKSGKSFFQGELAELIIYTRALSDDERTAVEGYLRGKWLDGHDIAAAPSPIPSVEPPPDPAVAEPDPMASETASDAKPPDTTEPPVEHAMRFVPLLPVQVEADGGSELQVREDGVVLAQGETKKGAVYRVAVQPQIPQITAILLEALPDERLPGQGPGRGAGGSFSLAEFALAMETPTEPPTTQPIRIGHAMAEGAGGVERLIDGDANTSWTVRRRGQRTAIMFLPNEPLPVPENCVLRCTLVNRENLGCFRLQATSAPDPRSLSMPDAAGPGAAGADRFELFVNLGGEAWRDPEGHEWQKSKEFDGATFGHEGGRAVTAKDEENPVARTALRGISAFRAVVPNGSYEVALYFHEHWTSRPESRMILLRIEHQSRVTPEDVLRAPGLGGPYIHRIPRVLVSDGRLDIDLTPATPESTTILNGVSIRQLP
jgi:hypothetical protein